MRGIYELDSMQHEIPAFDIRSTFIGSGIDEKDGTQWGTITVAGDTVTTLAITFQGARPSPDDGSLRLVTKRVSVQRGAEYRCDVGEVVGKPQQMFVRSVKLTYNRGDERYGLRSKSLQTTRLRRASEGSMAARFDVREARVFSLWSEIGAGIPYWIDVTPYWARWDTYDDVSGTKTMSPQVMAGIQREEYEKQNGAGAPALVAPNVSTSIDAAGKPTDSAPLEVPTRSVTDHDLQTFVQNMSEGASLEGVTRQRERIMVRFHFTDPAQIATS